MQHRETPPEDATRYIPTGNLHDRTRSTNVPRAHTVEGCPHLDRADEVEQVEPGESTPKVEVPNRRSNVVASRAVTVPWCEYCQAHHDE